MANYSCEAEITIPPGSTITIDKNRLEFSLCQIGLDSTVCEIANTGSYIVKIILNENYYPRSQKTRNHICTRIGSALANSVNGQSCENAEEISVVLRY